MLSILYTWIASVASSEPVGWGKPLPTYKEYSRFQFPQIKVMRPNIGHLITLTYTKRSTYDLLAITIIFKVNEWPIHGQKTTQFRATFVQRQKTSIMKHTRRTTNKKCSRIIDHHMARLLIMRSYLKKSQNTKRQDRNYSTPIK